jgi:hypothetical protein
MDIPTIGIISSSVKKMRMLSSLQFPEFFRGGDTFFTKKWLLHR